MGSSKLLVMMMMMLYCILQSIDCMHAACVCKEPGVDKCAPCSGHTVVRPKAKPAVAPVALPPIGDNCWCNKLSVQPAALPKTCDKHNAPCSKCKPKAYAHDNTIYKAPAVNYDTPLYNNPPPNYYRPPPYSTYDSPPADPVSISLAVRAGKAISVPESKIAYGFIQKPIDGLPKIQFSDVPEENLFKLNNEVITLKKPISYTKPEDEYLIEENDEEDDSAYEHDVDFKLTYKQLGYETENFVNPKFRRLLPAYAVSQPSYPAKLIYAKAKVDCGVKPGPAAHGYIPKKSNCPCKGAY